MKSIFFVSLLTPWALYAQTPCQSLSTLNLPDSTSQMILVKQTKGFHAELYVCQRTAKTWHAAWKRSFKAVIGKNGVVDAKDKKEGDMKTPKGLYPISTAFGTIPLALRMDYRYITKEDKFIDDAKHPGYNTWVMGKTDAKHYENMNIKPYKMGFVIDYNVSPTIPGAGSAIFMHLWRTSETPTAGCVALEEHALRKILFWLDKSRHPLIWIQS